MQVKTSKNNEKSLHFLGFLWPNPAFSKACGQKNKKTAGRLTRLEGCGPTSRIYMAFPPRRAPAAHALRSARGNIYNINFCLFQFDSERRSRRHADRDRRKWGILRAALIGATEDACRVGIVRFVRASRAQALLLEMAAHGVKLCGFFTDEV